MCENTRRYVTLFNEVIDELMRDIAPTKNISDQDEVIDVILHQRRERNQHNEQTDQAGFPEHMLRR
jgi:DNA replication licensing factor MCM7